MPEGANDHGFAMTSSFTCMVLTVLLTLGGRSADATVVEALAGAGEHVLDSTPSLAARSQPGLSAHRVPGQRFLKALARESALKTLALTAGRVATWFDSPLGFRHGPKSVIDPQTLVIVYVSNDPYTRLYDTDILAAREAMPTGAVLAVSGQPDDSSSADDTWFVSGVEDVEDVAASLPFCSSAQLLALHLSLALGRTRTTPSPTTR